MKKPALRQLITRFEDPVTLLEFEGVPPGAASWEETDIEPQIFLEMDTGRRRIQTARSKLIRKQ